MYVRFLVFAFLVFNIIIAAGCNSISSGFNKLGYERIDSSNKKIQEVRTEYQSQVDELNRRILINNKELERLITQQMQYAANELFAAQYAFTLNLSPNRNAIVIDKHVKTAFTYINLAPSPEIISKTIEEVTLELNEQKTTIEDLRKKYDSEKIKAAKLIEDKTRLETDNTALKTSINVTEAKATNAINELQSKRDDDIKNILNAQQKKLDDEADRQKLIHQLMMTTGGVALIALIIAIFVPAYKSESATLAAILGAVTIILPFIETWMVVTGTSISILLFFGWLLYRHNATVKEKQKIIDTESKISKNLVNVIQDIKTNNKDVYDIAVKPALVEWNTIVKQKDDGTIIKTEDMEVVHAIDEKLIASDRK